MAGSILFSAAPYHIISYGSLLGTQLFQSFIGGTTAYRALPRAQFSTLQSAIFPTYFSMQTILPLIIAFTLPPERIAIGTKPGSISGVLDPSNRLSVLTPLLLMFVGGLANLVYLGPETTRVMKERKHQETRDGKKSYDPPPHSDKMQTLNKQFFKLHGISSLVNMVSFVATLWYGFYLADRIS